MSDGKKHALLAPSSCERWFVCPGSVLLEKDIPEGDNEYSLEGTAAHEYAAAWLSTGIPPILPWVAKNGVELSNSLDNDRFYAIEKYVHAIQALSYGHELLVEQALPIEHLTGEKGATGTGDAIILHNDGSTIEINDLKFGMGVKVYAKRNKQMMMYALGALYQFSVLGDFKKIVMRIHQPRLEHLDEWECAIEELQEFADEVKFKADFIWRLVNSDVKFKPLEDLVPTEEGCRFCKAKATCPALSKKNLELIAEDFVDLDKNPVVKLNSALDKLQKADNQQLSWFMQNIDLIETWCKAVRARVEIELLAGNDVPGYKLVEGRKGNRQWVDEDEVIRVLKSMRLKDGEMYKSKLISPSDAEKLFKKEPRRLERIKKLYAQSNGQPSVAASTDPRPTLIFNNVDDFDDLTLLPVPEIENQ